MSAITYLGTKKVGHQNYIIFENEDTGARAEIPLDSNQAAMILHHLDRLAPAAKLVEEAPEDADV